jgi:hypothetical protein
MARAWSRFGTLWLVGLAVSALGCNGGGDKGGTTGPAYVKASNPDAQDFFGTAVALSADGTTMVVGAFGESSNATGINGAQGDDSRTFAGAVYVYTRAGGGRWAQQAYVKNPGYANAMDYFGNALALSADGNTLAVGAWGESNATGAVHIFTRSGSTWTFRQTLHASNAAPDDRFGVSVALSADGTTLAVGAQGEASNATGIDGNQDYNSAAWAGAVYVFTGSGATWTQQAYVKASNTTTGDCFGHAVALSADGSVLAVGAFAESSAFKGIGATAAQQADESALEAGAVYVFTRAGGTWIQHSYLKASNASELDHFGSSVSLSADGGILAVGAPSESSAATGIDGDQTDDSAPAAGAVYLFVLSGGAWRQQAYVKPSYTGEVDTFGRTVALDGSGARLAVGAPMEDGSVPGLDGDPSDNGAPASGAVYLFTHGASGWAQQHYVKAPTVLGSEYFGDALAWSADGSTLAEGADGEGSKSNGIGGDQSDRSAPEAGAVLVY